MAWRISEQVVRGEIDNRKKDIVTGRIWLLGREAPLELRLKGNCNQDIAGCLLTFSNEGRLAEGNHLEDLDALQEGRCGDLTASRKCKISPAVDDATAEVNADGVSYSWANILHLEWYSEHNGWLLIECLSYEYELGPPQWRLSEEELAEQKKHAAEADAEAVDDESIERILRINDLRYEAEQLAGGDLVFQHTEHVPPEIEEKFWENVIHIEKAPVMTRREMLAQDGCVPPAIEDLAEAEIRVELWKVIHALAERRHYLSQTDHLSDRELYQLILNKVLEEEVHVLSAPVGWSFHVLLSEYGSLDGALSGDEIYLTYYADAEWREQWQEEHSDLELPESLELPYERDDELPVNEDLPREDEEE